MLNKDILHLSNYTTLRIGGPARILTQVKTCDELCDAAKKAARCALKWRVIGHGSNILVDDDGVESAVIVYKNNEAPIILNNGLVQVSGGAKLNDVILFLTGAGLGGLENLAGIPGTIAGAVAGNAGAYGSSIGDSVLSAQIFTQGGWIKEIQASDLGFSYRHSIIKNTCDAILNVTLNLKKNSPQCLRKCVEEKLADRAMKHPDPKLTPTAGSWFKNPLDATGKRIAAGKLLEAAGCKSFQVGGASLWSKHANIIVTDGNAKASEVKELAKLMAEQVEKEFGIRLEQEVCCL